MYPNTLHTHRSPAAPRSPDPLKQTFGLPFSAELRSKVSIGLGRFVEKR